MSLSSGIEIAVLSGMVGGGGISGTALNATTSEFVSSRNSGVISVGDTRYVEMISPDWLRLTYGILLDPSIVDVTETGYITGRRVVVSKTKLL